jgi:hypothetical protein
VSVLPRLVASVGRCELAGNIGIPVLQALAWKMVLAGGKHHKLLRGVDQYHRSIREQWHPARAERAMRPVTMESRLSFEEAWGISPVEQVAMEAATLKLCSTTGTDWATYLARFAGDNRLTARCDLNC